MKRLFLAWAWWLPALLSGQQAYHVSPTGNDSNDGSASAPWQTLAYAAGQLNAGDTLWVHSGNYTGNVRINASGTPANPVVISGFPGDTVTLHGNGLAHGLFLMKLEHVSHIHIRNIRFGPYQASDAKGIVIENARDISIRNCEFFDIDYAPDASGQIPSSNDNAQPLVIYGSDESTPTSNIEISYNLFHDNDTGYSEVVALNGNVEGFKIEGNIIRDNANIGIDLIGFEGVCPDESLDQARNGTVKNNILYNNRSPYDQCAGIYVDGGKNIIIENNISYLNNYGIEIGCENGNATNTRSAKNIVIRNNLIYGNTDTGIKIGGYDYPDTGKTEQIYIYNNTLYNNDTENDYNGEMYLDYTENTVIENNIFYATNTEKVIFISNASNPGLHLDYNLYYSPSGGQDLVIEINGNEYNEFSTYRNATGLDTHSAFADPMFVSVSSASPDLHILSVSPAVDTGNPNYMPQPDETDIDGQTRIINGRIDCGADEFDPSQSLKKFTNVDCCYPVPVTDKLFIKPEFADYSIRITDLDGKIYLTKVKDKLYIDVQKLPPGIYILYLSKADRHLFTRIIKKGTD